MFRKLLIPIVGIALIGALAFVFAACKDPENGGGDPITSTAALDAAIGNANTAKEGVAIDTAAGNVDEGTKWVTQAEMDALLDAIAAAETAKANSTTQTQINNAVAALNAAIETFEEAKKDGEKPVVVGPTPITSVDIEITAPVRKAAPDTTPTTDDTDYEIGTVVWSVGDVEFTGDKFGDNTAYTVTISLTANEDFSFTGLTAANAKINTHQAAIANNTGETVTLSYTFPATLDKDVTGISITADPTKMSYTHGDTLDLTGITISINYDTGDPDTIAYAQFEAKGIETVPANGGTLRFDTHNGEKIEVDYIGHKAETSGTLTVGKKSVTITGVSASNKSYDGNADATITGTAIVSGKLSEDTVTVTQGTAAFADKDVATGKTVTFTGFSLGGDDAANYELTGQPASVTANITARAVTITGVTASNKTYDGTATAAITGTAALSVNYDGANLSINASSATATFADKNVGNGKTVTFSGYSLTGSASGNYTLSAQPASVTANITAKTLTWATVGTVTSRQYDGTTTATVETQPTLSGKIEGDTVTVTNGTAAFASAVEGSTAIASGYGISGADASNYQISGQPTFTGKIYEAADIFTFSDPNTISGLTDIGKTLEHIYINEKNGSNDITAIGIAAFDNQSSNSSIPNAFTFAANSKVASIGAGAFRRSNIAEITISASVTEIEVNAFANCLGLRKVIFERDGNTTIAYTNAFPQDLVNISGGTGDKNRFGTYISTSHTSGWIKIDTSTPIDPDNITSAKELLNYLFLTDGGDTPENPISIKINVDSLTNTEGGIIRSILFQFNLNSDNPKYISIDLSGSTFDLLNLGMYDVFQGLTSIVSVILPDTVTTIPNYAFSGCTSLASVNIPDGVTSIGIQSFESCPGLTSITIPASVNSIASYAFQYSDNLTSINIPASVTNIGTGAFRSCTNLRTVIFEGSDTTFGNNTTDFPNGTSLYAAYITNNGGAGTYYRASNTWVKQ